MRWKVVILNIMFKLKVDVLQFFTYHFVQSGPKKTDTQFYFRNNFGNSAPILTILSLLQAEIYGT